ncbi:MAG: ATP synthase F1 subunit gamma [Butyricicoccus sp.]|nr:ATP synthase F1 subunit gamma [Butyricicoccus sp.]MBQ8578377.1 ATP synthase F1 subunit gamma [Clostridia bacterium]
MAGANEIKSRIEGVRETKKITDAMYMISSAKMRRALRDLAGTTPYFEALGEKIGELFHYIPQTKNRYFSVTVPEDQPHQTHGILLITADKGMAGAYNQEAIRVCEECMARHPQTKIFIIGEYGRQYFLSHKLPYVQDFLYSAAHPRLTDARKICAELLEHYDSKKLDEISIIYTDYIGTKPGVAKRIKLLPLTQTEFSGEDAGMTNTEREFLPDPDTVLDGIIPSYLMGFIYGCLVESFCSEQQARMTAMKSAGDNAEDMLKTLRVQYNKIRQASITNEMIEITAGVRALKRRHKPDSGEDQDGNE